MRSVRHKDRRGMQRIEAQINEILGSEVPDLLGEFVRLPAAERERIIRLSAIRIREQRLTDAVAAAEHGDMRPARALVDAAIGYWLRRSPPSPSPHDGHEIPSLSRFLQPPRREGKGNRFPKNTTDKLRNIAWDGQLTSLNLAVKDAARIRKIVKEHRLPRLTGNFSPTAIAARRWGVADDRVLEWQKSKLRPRPQTK
jgi:hypothetical protein